MREMKGIATFTGKASCRLPPTGASPHV